jgi:hypothetical protein
MTIRKLAAAVILSAVLMGTAEAQVARRYAGITGGATYSSLTNYAGIDTDWRWGGTAGLFGGVTTFDYSFVEFAPSWVQMGGGPIAGVEPRIDYIELPLMLGGLVPMGNRDALFRMYAGVGINVKLSCDDSIDCDAVNSTTWTLPIGISFAKAVGTGRFIGIDARYYLGLSDSFDVGETTQRAWRFGAFFGLPVGN